MKRLLIILSLLFAGASSFAQEGPTELTFKNTRFVDGASKETLYERAEAWEKHQLEEDGTYNSIINKSDEKIIRYFHIINDCPNFGLSKFLYRYGTAIHFNIDIYCRDNSYTAEIHRIEVWMNPDLGILYGEDGMLYEDLYNRKQLKMGREIVDFLYDYTDAMFEEIYSYMSEN